MRGAVAVARHRSITPLPHPTIQDSGRRRSHALGQ